MLRRAMASIRIASQPVTGDGMFFRRVKDLQQVKEGAVFRRLRSDRTVETAHVLSVAQDTFGIPHVRYELSIEKPLSADRMVEGPRVLALSAFSETYRECVAS